MSDRLADVEVHVHHTTERAVLVSTDGDSDGAIWVPLSEVDSDNPIRSGLTTTLTMPEWLAKEKGLI